MKLSDAIVFRDLLPQEIEEIEQVAEEEIYPSGKTIFHEGDPGDSLYVVKSGEVCITRATQGGVEKVLARLGPRSFFGEMSLLDGRPRSATATAEVRCDLWRISKRDIDNLLGNNSIAAYKVILAFSRTLCYRLRKMNDALMELFSDPDRTISEVMDDRDVSDYLMISGWSVDPE